MCVHSFCCVNIKLAGLRLGNKKQCERLSSGFRSCSNITHHMTQMFSPSELKTGVTNLTISNILMRIISLILHHC